MILTDKYTDSPCGTVIDLNSCKIMFEGIRRTDGSRNIVLFTHHHISDDSISDCKYDSIHIHNKLDEIWDNPLSETINFVDEYLAGMWDMLSAISRKEYNLSRK